ncbi:hypothetical protein PQX77_002460, partial [Marasmius sp. AFHP31]
KMKADQNELMQRHDWCLTVSSSSKSTRRSPHFDPHAQRVDVGGRHKFIPPGHGDLRGPCPGLNALTNHNYLPHNGIGTMDQFIAATHNVFGMGLDMAIFLAILGSVISGDATTNTKQTSPTRGGLYLTGDNVHLNLTQFKSLYNKHPDHYDISLLNHFRYKRFQDSIHTNPYFFNRAFSGVAVQPAGSFFGVSSEDFIYRQGWERIPDNWYKRAVGDDYDLASYALDVLNAALEYPIFLSVGGNTGTVDSFTAVSIDDLKVGVLNAETLLKGDNLLCFLVEAAVQAATPDILRGVVGDVVGALEALKSSLNGRDCPPLEEFNTRSLERFPGYARRK